MGLFSKSTLSLEENRRLKHFKTELRRYGVRLSLNEFIRCLNGSDELLIEAVQCYENSREIDKVFVRMIEDNVSVERIDKVLQEMNKDDNLRGKVYGMLDVEYLTQKDEELVEVLKVFEKNGLDDLISSEHFMARAFEYNYPDVASYCLDRAINNSENLRTEKYEWSKMPDLLHARMDDIYNITNVSPEYMTEQLISCFIKGPGILEEPIEKILEYHKQKGSDLSALDLDRITKGIKFERPLINVLDLLQAPDEYKAQKTKSLAQKNHNLIRQLELGLESEEDKQAFKESLINKFRISKGNDINDAIKAGLELKDFDGDVLIENMPDFISRCDEGFDLGPIFSSLKKHAQAKQIFDSFIDRMKLETGNFEKLKLCFEYTEFKDSEILEHLKSSLGNKNVGYLSRFYISQISGITNVDKSFLEKVACEHEQDIVQSLIDKGLVFGEQISMVKEVSYKNNTGEMDNFFKKIEKEEQLNGYPIWRKQGDEIIEEVSIFEIITDKKMITLSRRFNFKAGVMDMVYKTHEGGELKEINPAQTLALSELSDEFTQEAKERLKNLGGLSNDNIASVKRSLKPPKSATS